MTKPEVRIRSWARGTADDERTGLIGYVSIFYGDLIITGITVRRTAAGQLVLSFPERRDQKGRSHAVVQPADQSARRELEAAIFGEATLASEVQQ